jgi:endonuclease/exonuclease/phosphatase family metal-dependent hydrolase
VLDHILVSPATPVASYQVIHINAEFTNQTSDHDPQMVRLTP